MTILNPLLLFPMFLLGMCLDNSTGTDLMRTDETGFRQTVDILNMNKCQGHKTQEKQHLHTDRNACEALGPHITITECCSGYKGEVYQGEIPVNAFTLVQDLISRSKK